MNRPDIKFGNEIFDDTLKDIAQQYQLDKTVLSELSGYLLVALTNSRFFTNTYETIPDLEVGLQGIRQKIHEGSQNEYVQVIENARERIQKNGIDINLETIDIDNVFMDFVLRFEALIAEYEAKGMKVLNPT